MQNTRLERRPASGGGFGRIVEGPAAWLITFVVIPGLLIVAMLLPPINLLDRLQALTYTRIPATGGAITDPEAPSSASPMKESVLASLPPYRASRAPSF